MNDSSSNYLNSPKTPHVVLFPFMSKGHTIPLLHLARFLLKRTISVTIFTTPANRPFISQTLFDANVSIIDLPFPKNVDLDIPPGVESTDKIPSILLFLTFANATELMQPEFERALETLPPVNFMVTDGFLWWTLESASKFGIPRIAFYGLCNYAFVLNLLVIQNKLLEGPETNNELIAVPHFPRIKFTKGDFRHSWHDDIKYKDLNFEFVKKTRRSRDNSFGLISNSFYELEPEFVDFWNQNFKPKVWCVGPLCLAEVQSDPHINKPEYVEWLDQKAKEQGRSVLYVAFGSQAEISSEQMKEIATGLEESMVNFLWVIRKWELTDGFEERVKNRGLVVRDWVDQREILMHKSVKGFLSHCGWNSVMESICAGVPILAWPMMAEQPFNAKMVTEELKVGLRVETCDGSVRGLVKSETLKKMVKELMEGKIGKEMGKKVKEYAEMGKKAVEEGGSSRVALDSLIDQACEYHQSRKLDDLNQVPIGPITRARAKEFKNALNGMI